MEGKVQIIETVNCLSVRAYLKIDGGTRTGRLAPLRLPTPSESGVGLSCYSVGKLFLYGFNNKKKFSKN